MIGNSTQSYSLKKITTFLDSENISYKVSDSILEIYSTGCCVNFPNTDIKMSVLTSPNISGPNFAQTAIMNRDGILRIPSLEYGNSIINHPEIDDIISHIRMMNISLNGRNAVDFPDAENHIGRSSEFRRPNPPSPPESQPPSQSEIPQSNEDDTYREDIIALMNMLGLSFPIGEINFTNNNPPPS